MRDGGKFIASFIATVKETFPYVYVVTRSVSYDLPVNFIVIAGKRPVNLENLNKEEDLSDAQLIIHNESDLAAFEKKVDWIALDDDYVPVENFMTPVVQRISAISIADKYITQAEQLSLAGQNEDAINKYRMAMQICPAFSAMASNSISQIMTNREKPAMGDVNQTKK
jgi:hypothetical protein